jgi:hypothetical protein
MESSRAMSRSTASSLSLSSSFSDAPPPRRRPISRWGHFGVEGGLAPGHLSDGPNQILGGGILEQVPQGPGLDGREDPFVLS